MDKDEARKKFDMITGWLAQEAMEGEGSSVFDLTTATIEDASFEDLLWIMQIFASAEITLEDLSLPEDNKPLPVATGVKGFYELTAYLYGFGAVRYLAIAPGQPMGGGMWDSFSGLIGSLKESAPQPTAP